MNRLLGRRWTLRCTPDRFYAGIFLVAGRSCSACTYFLWQRTLGRPIRSAGQIVSMAPSDGERRGRDNLALAQ